MTKELYLTKSLLLSGFYFLGEFVWLILVLRDNIALLLLAPIALIILSLLLKKINFVVLAFIGFALVAFSV